MPANDKNAKGLPLELQGLMLGANLSLEEVKEKICPECEFHTSFCDFMLAIHLSHVENGLSFVCKGMRHWATKSN